MAEYPFVQARHFTRGRNGKRPIWIVLHDMEAPEASGTAEALARAAARWDRKASWHIGVDNDSEVRSVKDGDTAYAAKGANVLGLHIEHAGYAKQSAAEWRDKFSDAMLARSAKVAQRWVREYNIPIRKLTVAQTRAYSPGFVDHATVEKAFPSSGHWDPGPNFPWDYYLDLVRAVPLLPSTPGAIMNDCTDAIVCPQDGGLQKLQGDGGVFNDNCSHFHGSYHTLPAEHRNATRHFRAIVRREGTGYSIVANDGAVYDFPA